MRCLKTLGVKKTVMLTGDHEEIGKKVAGLEQSMAHIQPQAPTTLHDEETELQRIEAALKAAGGNKSKAAQLLAVDRKTLYNKMKPMIKATRVGSTNIGQYLLMAFCMIYLLRELSDKKERRRANFSPASRFSS